MDNRYKLISVDNYEYDSWLEKFPNYKVNLKNLYIHPDWNDFFKSTFKDERFERIENHLSHCLKVTDGKIKIYPYPDLVFSALNATPLDSIKVVILGQDPYHKNESHTNIIIPQAMGMSFSVPVGIKIPSSLRNIYKNMVNFNHQIEMPSHGNLESWAYQGVLMLNTAFTVQHGCPNSHHKYWNWLTDNLIKYISKHTNNTIFVLWGRPAYEKSKFIDQKKHKIIISSHPSGYSCHNKMGNHSAFNDQDHFRLINKYLKKTKKDEIFWHII